MHSAPTEQGVIVVDPSFKVLASNPEVLQILTYPQRPDAIHNLDSWLVKQVRDKLVNAQKPGGITSEVQLARRTYICRSFSLEAMEPHRASVGQSGKLLIVMLERKSNETAALQQVSARFGLTPRERETIEFLIEGFTSKEIAQRMNISANTVKAFIRLVMVKMNVSTRSGILGKIACPRPSIG